MSNVKKNLVFVFNPYFVHFTCSLFKIGLILCKTVTPINFTAPGQKRTIPAVDPRLITSNRWYITICSKGTLFCSHRNGFTLIDTKTGQRYELAHERGRNKVKLYLPAKRKWSGRHWAGWSSVTILSQDNSLLSAFGGDVSWNLVPN